MGQHRTHIRRKGRTNSRPHKVTEGPELRLPPEEDDGNVEYKSHLIKPSMTRFQHLVTQMKWRLHEGQGEAIYAIGVEDDGTMSGLESKEMSESMQTLYRMASNIEASLVILNDRCVHGRPEEPTCRRVIEVLVRKLPADQQFIDLRIAVLGSASAGKSTLCGVLTQGVLDNGNGKCRLNFLRYVHEIRTGKTSSVNLDFIGFSTKGELLNYKNHDLKEILENSSKLITLIDLAGDRKYLKTTIYGVSGYTPHFCALLVNARVGWTAMSDEHWEIAAAFSIPVFLIITKIDLVSPARVQTILQQIESAINRSGKKLRVAHVNSVEDTVRCAAQMVANEVFPVFSVSSVTGANLDCLTEFLKILPLRNCLQSESMHGTQPLFYIDEIFNLPDSGTVVCGLVAEGQFSEGDSVQIGPDNSGAYHFGRIHSLRRNKQPALVAQKNETASLAIQFRTEGDEFTIRKGMVLLSGEDVGVCCRRFVARFSLLSHSVPELCVGFQGTVYIGPLRRTVTVRNFEPSCLRRNEWTEVTFEFYGGPEFVRVGMVLFFRERDTKGVGRILRVPE